MCYHFDTMYVDVCAGKSDPLTRQPKLVNSIQPDGELNVHNYVRQAGYVFVAVCVTVCAAACKICQKVANGF